jgi:hypothetical protein
MLFRDAHFPVREWNLGFGAARRGAANVVQIRRTAMVVIVMGVTGAIDVSMLQKLS